MNVLIYLFGFLGLVSNAAWANTVVTSSEMVQIQMEFEIPFDDCSAEHYYQGGGGTSVTCVFEIGFDPNADYKFSDVELSDSYTEDKVYFSEGHVIVQFISLLWLDDNRTVADLDPQDLLKALKARYAQNPLSISLTYSGPKFDTSRVGVPVIP